MRGTRVQHPDTVVCVVRGVGVQGVWKGGRCSSAQYPVANGVVSFRAGGGLSNAGLVVASVAHGHLPSESPSRGPAFPVYTASATPDP